MHPVLKRQDRLGKEPFAGFGTVVEDITESGYTKNQPILLGPFWENAFFVFLHYKIKQKKSQIGAQIPLNLTSEGQKYPPHIVLHVSCWTRTSGGYFRPSEVRFRAKIPLSSHWFYNVKTQKTRFLKKPPIELADFWYMKSFWCPPSPCQILQMGVSWVDLLV